MKADTPRQASVLSPPAGPSPTCTLLRTNLENLPGCLKLRILRSSVEDCLNCATAGRKELACRVIRNVFTLDAGSLQRNLRIVKNGEYSYIELFAGCGGMSLGLEAAGFQRILANEISPMAAETFAYNLVKGARGSEPPRPAFPESWDPHFTFLDPPTGVNGGILAEGRFRDWRLHSSRGWKPSEKAKAAALGRGSSDLLVGHAGKLATLLEHLKSEHPRKFHKRFGDVAQLV